MTLKDLLENTDVEKAHADLGILVHGVSYDTRSLRAGEIFVAVRGYESDGHQYIGEAFEKGALCVICEQPPPDPRLPHILVKDSRKALATVSAAWFGHPASKIRIIGVTGTNGKTTVTCLIKRVIEKYTGEKVGLIGTIGNMVGEKEITAGHTTPESYNVHKMLALMVKEGCAYAVMEVSSHALYLNRVHGIEFEVGVFTNISPDHLDFHQTMQQYAKAKSILFENSLKSAINIDDEYAPVMKGSARGNVFTYAVNDGTADLVGKNVKLHADKVEFCALMIGSLNRLELKTPGMFSVYNGLAVISAAMLLGFKLEKVVAVMQTLQGVKGRAEVVPTGSDFTVLIDYAHTPDALENIIKALRGFRDGRLVTLFGCGGDRDRKKRSLMGGIAAKFSDFVVVTSDNPRTEEPGEIISDILAGMKNMKTPYRVIENRREAIYWALKNLAPQDVLILAGKGHETYQIIGKEKTHFDEREVVSEYFEGVKKKEFGATQ